MFKYPTGRVDRDDMDYVVFEHFDWTPNFNKDRTVAKQSMHNRPPSTGQIMLYMPTSTPAVANGNKWNALSGVGGGGAFGRAAMGLAGTAGATASGDFGSAFDKAGFTVGDGIRNYRQIAAQLALTVAVKGLGVSPSQAMQLGSGKILNPNVELMYEGPELRAFGMQFDFVPRNRNDKNEMQKIIYEFKHKSAPVPDNNLYKIPKVWQITYVSGGKLDVMNRFKRAALVNVEVVANPDTNMHATFDDGTPISTSLKLSFMETDVITSLDHEETRKNGLEG